MDTDIVVLWVDGNDPLWLAEKKKYSPVVVDDSNADYRFRDNGLLKYWFRSIDQNLPWARKIHFVTWGHLPAFLNVNNPKINIVRHCDYMPLEALPTFNACSIEVNLHRIEGLSEQFVFFNDDMYVLRPMNEEQFFSHDGLPTGQFTEIPTIFKGHPEVWQMLMANDVGIINDHLVKKNCQRGHAKKYFSLKNHWYDNIRSIALRILFPEVFTGFKNFHAPAAYLKNTFTEVWDEEPDLLMETTKHRFRDMRDVNQWLMLWWQLAKGRFEPCRMNTATLSADELTVDSIYKTIINQKYDMICINDPPTVADFDVIVSKLQSAFDTIFPNKSSFEN